MKIVKTLIIFCSICLLCISFRSGADFHNDVKSRQFKLTIIRNTASGSTSQSYTISRDKLRVYDKPFANSGYTENLFTDHKFKTTDFFSKLDQLGLDELDSSYINKCASVNSRVDYMVVYQTKSKVSKIEVRGYYLDKMRQLIELINNFLSSPYRIEYLSKETKQDCN